MRVNMEPTVYIFERKKGLMYVKRDSQSENRMF